MIMVPKQLKPLTVWWNPQLDCAATAKSGGILSPSVAPH
jgi:hypothetical protein